MKWGVGRKFIAFLISMFIFLVIMLIAIYKGGITDLGMFAFLLATAIMQISGAYYAGNVWEKKKGVESGTTKE
jgi:hypothetical protein